MPAIHPKVLERLRTLTPFENDYREATETEIRSLVYFNRYVLDEHSQISAKLYAYSIRQRSRDYLLVVKGILDGTPQVAFYSAQNPISCVEGFVRAWLNDLVKWQPDRYA